MPSEAAMRVAKVIASRLREDLDLRRPSAFDELTPKLAEIIDQEMGIDNPPAPLRRSTMPIDGGNVYVWQEWLPESGEYALSKIEEVSGGERRVWSRWPPL